MAIAFVGSADLGGADATTNITPNYTVGSGLNRLLVLSLLGDFGPGSGGTAHDDITTVTYAGSTMLLGAKTADTNNNANVPRYIYLYYLLAPASGSNAFSISCTNSHLLRACAADYTGVGAFDAASANSSAYFTDNTLTNSFTASLGTVADNSWVMLASSQFSSNNPPTGGSGATVRSAGATYGEPALSDSNGPVTPPSSYSMTLNLTSSSGWAFAMASFSPSASGAVYIPSPRRFRNHSLLVG